MTDFSYRTRVQAYIHSRKGNSLGDGQRLLYWLKTEGAFTFFMDTLGEVHKLQSADFTLIKVINEPSVSAFSTNEAQCSLSSAPVVDEERRISPPLRNPPFPPAQKIRKKKVGKAVKKETSFLFSRLDNL